MILMINKFWQTIQDDPLYPIPNLEGHCRGEAFWQKFLEKSSNLGQNASPWFIPEKMEKIMIKFSLTSI